jgi:DNA gyrase subunit A
MSSDVSESSGETDAARIDSVRIEDEMEQSYIDYAMSVIAGRALPKVEDGLKPVHRRILYAMERDGVTSGATHRKSSKVVGDAMGDFHPHGDSAIYDTLARMAQPFSMRAMLVDGQGNFGSVDGDPPAAMRYTESRMSAIAEELLADIEKDTVPFSANYDDRLEEPDVLPAAFPNLLVNGSSGIAVGMSTNIPPHNLGEVIDATIHLIENPDCTIPDLMEHVPGPDFPTGATIVGREGIYEAYESGRGRIRVRADYEVEESGRNERIVVTELPFQTNKARLITRIADAVNNGKLEGIRDLRDESDRDGIRVVIELKQGAVADVVETRLLDGYLESTFGVINLALVDGEPRVLTLKETLAEYVAHRREVVRRRSAYDLAEAEDRAHILEGRLRALSNTDSVIETIREAADREAAREALREGFDFTERQADHVVRMQLGSLTAMEAEEIEREHEEVSGEIERLETILGDEAELDAVITEELRGIRGEYADERRTTIADNDGTVTHEDLIPEEEVLITLTESDYIKRMPVSRFTSQNRGGKGIIGTKLKSGDRVATVFRTNTHDHLLCFTNQGRVYELRGYEVPEMSRTARGTSAVNLLDFNADEEIAAVVSVADLDPEEFLTTVTKNGYVKRTSTEQFSNIRSTGIIATKLDPDDELVDVVVTDGSRDIVIATRAGRSIRFDESEVRAMGRSARGVRGMKTGEQGIAGIASVDERTQWLLTVTERGYGKRSPIDAYRKQSRNGKGLIDIKTNERNGLTKAIEAVGPGDHLFAMTEGGQITRTPVESISMVGRNTMGVTVMHVASGDRLASIDVLPAARRDDADVESGGDTEPDGDSENHGIEPDPDRPDAALEGDGDRSPAESEPEPESGSEPDTEFGSTRGTTE